MKTKTLSTNEISYIKQLRIQGKSINEIAEIIERSKSTISFYVRDLDIAPHLKNMLNSRRGGSALRAQKRRAQAYSFARTTIKNLSKRDQLLIAACLYWGEGNKKEFSFSNTDPFLIRTFVDCLISLGINKNRMKVSIRLYEDIDPKKATQFWARTVGISSSKIFGVNTLVGKKKGKAPYGMCRIRLTKGNDCFNLLMSSIKHIYKDLAPIAQWTEQRTPKP